MYPFSPVAKKKKMLSAPLSTPAENKIIGGTIGIGREIQSPPHAGFFLDNPNPLIINVSAQLLREGETMIFIKTAYVKGMHFTWVL